MKKLLILGILISLMTPSFFGQKKKETPVSIPAKEEKDPLSASILQGLKLRNIGPAFTSGRVSDLAVHPNNPAEYYVAAASGGVWKTINAGTTYTPIFDGQGAYSIGCVSLDPQNPYSVWVGTGENNGQRSVGYGDGVYHSADGGKSWHNMGLKQSEHIAEIIVHPDNSQVIYVASAGPLWSAGGERGVYKSEDGGNTWQNILSISEHTGVCELIMDPRNPNIMYAAAWQRRRHVFTWISGGPESAIYKTIDGGKNWYKIMTGLPSGDVGRIGLTLSPVNPDYVYAIVEASGEKGGVFRSVNQGESWEKRSNHQTIGLYYVELFADPVNINRIYSMDTYAMVSDDGGKTFTQLGEKSKHVDNHVLWIDPKLSHHYLMGCDGGIYESFDSGQNWRFHTNLPITQFYKVATDNSKPFYYVYGGTQDNFSLGGPSQTLNTSGISNYDWFVTQGGDGFESQVDPQDPNIVYAQYQHAGLVRFDRLSGEQLFIRPQEGKGEPGLRWNWDSPLLISPHSHTRLYFAANKLFRSDDRGNSWKAVSPDLTRQIDRNKLPVMGRVWGMDAVAKSNSTSIYGNITALDESALQEGLLYVGTDDGIIQVSDNSGSSWKKYESFPGIPEMTYVNQIVSSRHTAGTVYAAFNNHKNGDFKPYLMKSTDKGSTWSSISGNLPERGTVYCVAEDHIDPNLLFAGTEFGLFFSANGGQKWIQLKNGLPTIAVKDMEIQRRENDLVLATFGRGFYILDDYTPLRKLSAEILTKDAHLFPIKDALWYNPASPMGGNGKSMQGETFYLAENASFGAVITYYLKESVKTIKEKRQEAESKLVKEGKAVDYPGFDAIRAEDTEEKPYLLFTISKPNGEVVRKIRSDIKTGIQRLAWDLRYPSANPSMQGGEGRPGLLAAPGTYKVSIAKVVDGIPADLGVSQTFNVIPLNRAAIPMQDMAASMAFHRDVAELNKSARGVLELKNEIDRRITGIKSALHQTPGADLSALEEARKLEKRMQEISRQLTGDPSIERRNFETPPAIMDRIQYVMSGLYETTVDPTQTQRDAYTIAKVELSPLLKELTQIRDTDLKNLENKLDSWGAPWTPGRTPKLEE